MTQNVTLKFIPVQAAAATAVLAKADAPCPSIAVISINRPQAANAFSAEVIDELTAACSDTAKAIETQQCRAVIFQGKGKHFSAGADLAWMKQSATLSQQENQRDAGKLIELMEAVRTLPAPTIAVVRGSAYGGAVGITACCDYALAECNARFCLSEVRIGLMPAVILPYLNRKILPGQLQRLALSARVFSGEEALAFGLIQKTAQPLSAGETSDALIDLVVSELNQLLQCSPLAQAQFKKLQRHLDDHSHRQCPETAEAIARMRVSHSAQDGLQSFFAKTTPPWHQQFTNIEELYSELKVH